MSPSLACTYCSSLTQFLTMNIYGKGKPTKWWWEQDKSLNKSRFFEWQWAEIQFKEAYTKKEREGVEMFSSCNWNSQGFALVGSRCSDNGTWICLSPFHALHPWIIPFPARPIHHGRGWLPAASGTAALQEWVLSFPKSSIWDPISLNQCGNCV